MKSFHNRILRRANRFCLSPANYTRIKRCPFPQSRSFSSKLNKVLEVADFARRTCKKLHEAAFYLETQPVLEKYQQNKEADPIRLLDDDLKNLRLNIKRLISNQDPVLASLAEYYFDLQGKRIRPVIVLLMSRAISFHNNYQDLLINHKDADPYTNATSMIHPKQTQIAEIIEMIHTATLIHDDVIDEAHTRRGTTSINIAFSNKMAILGGDFLIARAAISLAELGNHAVTDLMSRIISDLVEGEFMQMTSTFKDTTEFDYYMEKTYKKTASLIANGCRSVAIIGNGTQDIVDCSTRYGKHLGLAFQLIDDMLDFVSSEEEMGKSGLTDLKSGIITAPVLYALEEFPEMRPLIRRKFSVPGDLEQAISMVNSSHGCEKTKQKAKEHCAMAIDAISNFTDSKFKQGLFDLTQIVLERKK
eukprot:TRINITY_DN6127_c0_g1_i2.p1 TRINITY_DN6127_c0_g1~~TRINITY_DN6127_c0_g1_i2.p1  ORF type:complete len:418 (-),score=69.55 TRINITY_DN6127_c0_g1_i2:28-1281(-)